MNKMRKGISILFFMAIAVASALAQSDSLEMRFEGKNVIVRLKRDIAQQALDSMLCSYGTCLAEMDSLWNSSDKTTPFGWKLESWGGAWIEMEKPVIDLSGSLGKDNHLLLDEAAAPVYETTFGSNYFKEVPSVDTSERGTCFTLFEHTDAQQVYLAGSFNNWDPKATPMSRTYEGWEACIPLAQGKHTYKFVVDGKWIDDPQNKQREDDWNGGYNSIFYVTNYRFELEGYEDARKVILAGSFNGWDERNLRLKEEDGKWVADVYLRDGTYSYRYIVNGDWVTDPSNPNKRLNEYGEYNSVIDIGEPMQISLMGYRDAQHVVLSGSFNNWSETELVMTKTAGGWQTSLVLAPGNYEYKFIVDGEWVLDPVNPVQIGEGNYRNSMMSIGANTQFFLKGHTEANEILLSGNFNDWSENGYTMIKTPTGWLLNLYLFPGKYTYKFIVDGKWISDPSNELYEGNEYGGYNSVRWIE